MIHIESMHGPSNLDFLFFLRIIEQAGTGPSRRHSQGSKIAKRLPSVKYSFLQYSKIENFSKKTGPSGAPGVSQCRVSQCRKTERGDPLRFFNIHSVAKHEKIEEIKNFYFRKKISQCRKKLKGGPFGIFQHPFCRKTAKKLKGGPFGEKNFRKKSLAVPKKIGTGDPLVSPGMVWYAGKQEKPFWFSSLDQIVQFGAIIFCRTFKNYFGQFVWIEKKKKSHYNSRVSLHEAPTKNGKKVSRLSKKTKQKQHWYQTVFL